MRDDWSFWRESGHRCQVSRQTGLKKGGRSAFNVGYDIGIADEKINTPTHRHINKLTHHPGQVR